MHELRRAVDIDEVLNQARHPTLHRRHGYQASPACHRSVHGTHMLATAPASCVPT